jgi:hypothetical protein
MTQLLPNVVAIEWRKNLAKLLVTSGIGTTRKWPAVSLASAFDRFPDHIDSLLGWQPMTQS